MPTASMLRALPVARCLACRFWSRMLRGLKANAQPTGLCSIWMSNLTCTRIQWWSDSKKRARSYSLARPLLSFASPVFAEVWLGVTQSIRTIRNLALAVHPADPVQPLRPVLHLLQPVQTSVDRSEFRQAAAVLSGSRHRTDAIRTVRRQILTATTTVALSHDPLPIWRSCKTSFPERIHGTTTACGTKWSCLARPGDWTGPKSPTHWTLGIGP